MRQYKSHLRLIGFLTGLMLGAFLAIQSANPSDDGDYKQIISPPSISGHVVHVFIPEDWPDFFGESYTPVADISISPTVFVSKFQNILHHNDGYWIVVKIYGGEMRVIAVSKSPSGPYLIYKDPDGLPTSVSVDEYGKFVTNNLY